METAGNNSVEVVVEMEGALLETGTDQGNSEEIVSTDLEQEPQQAYPQNEDTQNNEHKQSTAERRIPAVGDFISSQTGHMAKNPVQPTSLWEE